MLQSISSNKVLFNLILPVICKMSVFPELTHFPLHMTNMRTERSAKYEYIVNRNIFSFK